jgi:hypothetical protein
MRVFCCAWSAQTSVLVRSTSVANMRRCGALVAVVTQLLVFVLGAHDLGARDSLTTHEPSRAGPAAQHNLLHLDELRRPSGEDSGERVRHMIHGQLLRRGIMAMPTAAMPVKRLTKQICL